ncbi:MAG: DUF58 domain-containing protein [Holophagaceae bacterium]|nr:DUF58 domain-containing protein [Holophagaceae bacterium]
MYLWKDSRLHLRITRLGIQYVFLTGVVGGLGVYTSNNLLHTVFSLMIGMLLVSGWVSRAAFDSIKPSHVAEGTFFARTKGGLKLAFNDKTPKRTRCLEIRLEIQDCNAEPGFLQGEKKQTLTIVPIPIRPTKRGWAKISRIDLSTTYPFGWLEKTRRFPVDMQFLVAPRPSGYQYPEGGSGDNDDPTPKSGFSSPAGARPFVAGDSLSQIHWKRTAQRGEPWIRLLEGDQPRGILLELDLSAWVSGEEFEEELEKLSGAILQARIQKTDLTLVIQGQHGRSEVKGHIEAWKALGQCEAIGRDVCSP